MRRLFNSMFFPLRRFNHVFSVQPLYNNMAWRIWEITQRTRVMILFIFKSIRDDSKISKLQCQIRKMKLWTRWMVLCFIFAQSVDLIIKRNSQIHKFFSIIFRVFLLNYLQKVWHEFQGKRRKKVQNPTSHIQFCLSRAF